MIYVIRQLLDYLSTSFAACHAPAAALLWALEDDSGMRYVESALCQRMASSDSEERVQGFEAFGALWRCTDDAHMPGVRLESAVHIMLDSLRSDDLTSRRAGEGWMRCSLKSYVRYASACNLLCSSDSRVQDSRCSPVGSAAAAVRCYSDDTHNRRRRFADPEIY